MISIKKALRYAEDAYDSHTLSVRDCECLIKSTDQYQIVAFRGTEGLNKHFLKNPNWLDWIRDIRFIPWYSRKFKGWSHSGFYKGAKAVVYEGLKLRLDRTKPIIFIGHSLGGALALNAAELLDKETYNIHEVVTFGAPRTYLSGTADNISLNAHYLIRQYINPGDPVPNMPPSWLGYKHPNPMITQHIEKDDLFDNHSLDAYKEALL